MVCQAKGKSMPLKYNRAIIAAVAVAFAFGEAFAGGGAVVFDRDFRTAEGDTSLDGFDLVRQYNGVGKDAMRFAQGYGIAFPLRGNVHLARMPRERDCTADCSMYCDPSFGDSVGFDVYYRYDESTRIGGVLSITFNRKSGHAQVRSGVVRKLAYTWKEKTQIQLSGDDPSGVFKWRLGIAGNVVKFGSAVFSVPDGVPSVGRIGFDKFCPSAPVVIVRLSVVGEPGTAEELFPLRTWRFPRTELCSMSDWRFVFSATNMGPHTVLNAAVEGGPVEAFNRKIGYTRHLPNEMLDRPWFAVVRPDGTVEPRQYLYFGSIGYREHWSPVLPYLGKSDIECPVRRTFYMKGLSDGCRLLIGFDGFESEDRRYMGKLRKMMMVDPASGKVVTAGDVLDAKGLAVEVDSGSEKRICGMIPKSTFGYDEALGYAVRNHFFLEGEPAKFTVGVRQRKGRYAASALRVECVLQDAFRDTVRPLEATARPSLPAFPDEDGLMVEVKPLTLPIGVYHLGLEIWSGEEMLLRKSVAFEVMGERADAPRPQMASGLPEMMSPICDYQSESNVSDYRGMGGNDQTHYFAINGMQVLPTVERGDWDLNKLYQRRYFGWFAHGLVPGQNPEKYERLFKDIDYLCAGLVCTMRLSVGSPEAYAGMFWKVLTEFLKEKCEDDPELARLAADESVPMTLSALKRLFERHGQAWLDRAAEYHAEKSAAAIGKWKDIRELVHYFTVP